MEQKRRKRLLRRKKRNLEDVDATIRRLDEEKHSKKRNIAVTVLKWVFFPFTAVALLFSYIFATQKVRLTTKTTVIFTAIFGVLIASYMMFAIITVRNYLGQSESDKEFVQSMVITSISLGLIFMFVGTAAGAVISSAMLRPIRKMTADLEQIDGENLSQRLMPPDSQDEIMELAENINQMLDTLEETFARQSNFVSDASHELKTPLSVIRGYGDILDRWGKSDPAVLDEGIAAIRREATYMSKIIDQMLLLARLGKLAMHKQAVNITELVKEIVESYRVINSDYNLIFDGDSVTCECDKTMITEAVRAIIDNGIKYTPKGGSVRVFIEKDDGFARIRIRDTGIGIDDEDIPYIFDRFYRCDKTRGRAKGSAGLGLTICKSIIEMMGGRIAVKSIKGEGTEFVIII